MPLQKTKSEIRAARDWRKWKRIKSGKKKKKKIKVKKKKVFLSQLDIAANKLKKQPYKVFLQSDYWTSIRAMVLKRDKYKCTVCGTDKLLQVHHSTYKHHFAEHKYLHELHTLCETHHHEIHCIKDIV